MKHWPGLLLGVLVAFSGCTTAGARPTLNARKAGTVLFRDDFTGSHLDLTKWHVGWFGNGVDPTGPVNGAEDNCYAPGQVAVGGGQLHITATQQTCLGYPWRSGLIDTDGIFSFTTGILKAKVCAPGPGFGPDWPAVWTDGQHWPNDGEIDAVEGLNGNGAWHVHSTQPTVGGGHLGAGCHKIKYKRTATTVTFWYDGVKQGSASTSSFSNSPQYIVINLGVSSSISPPEQAGQFHVDWIQVTT